MGWRGLRFNPFFALADSKQPDDTVWLFFVVLRGGLML